MGLIDRILTSYARLVFTTRTPVMNRRAKLWAISVPCEILLASLVIYALRDIWFLHVIPAGLSTGLLALSWSFYAHTRVNRSVLHTRTKLREVERRLEGKFDSISQSTDDDPLDYYRW